ncbi:MAG: spondin domain-containing protein [Myxococcota bacterium]
MTRTSLPGPRLVLLVLLVLLSTVAPAACGGDDRPAAAGTQTESTGDASTTSTPSTVTGSTTGTDETTSASSGPPPLPLPRATDFVITVQNISATGMMRSPLSAGLWVNHDPGALTLFIPQWPDEGLGLQALAEDGVPAPLAAALTMRDGVHDTGVFDTPMGADEPGPLLPGDSYRFTVTAEPMTRLSLGLMVVGSNDLFIAPNPEGLSLFGGGGQPLAARDVSESLRVWDAGTEQDQAPGQGPFQALHGGSPDLGPAEPPVPSVIRPHQSSTRAIPLGPDLVEVVVTEDPQTPGRLEVRLINISQFRGTMVTPLSSLVWALHDDSVTLFTAGDPAPAALQALAEDGDTGPYDALLGGTPGVADHGVIPGPIAPGGTVSFLITPSAEASRLSLATMVVQSNDAFVALAPEGLPLLDDQGPIDAEALTARLAAQLSPWDAGTEANEVPGAGRHQPLRQEFPNTGPPETRNPTVHRYADVTDDLAGDRAGDSLAVTVDEQGGEFTLTLTNASGPTAFPRQLSQLVWVLHEPTFAMIEPDTLASSSLRALAEDGQGFGLASSMSFLPGVATAAVVDTPIGARAPMSLQPGQSYTIVVTPDATHRSLSFATMIQPSNDTFAALEPPGVALLDPAGIPRPTAAIEAELAAALRAWDAGTEGNQAGAAGADMMPGSFPSEGPNNGIGLVLPAADNEIWSVPPASSLVRVTIAPVER